MISSEELNDDNQQQNKQNSQQTEKNEIEQRLQNPQETLKKTNEYMSECLNLKEKIKKYQKELEETEKYSRICVNATLNGFDSLSADEKNILIKKELDQQTFSSPAIISHLPNHERKKETTANSVKFAETTNDKDETDQPETTAIPETSDYSNNNNLSTFQDNASSDEKIPSDYSSSSEESWAIKSDDSPNTKTRKKTHYPAQFKPKKSPGSTPYPSSQASTVNSPERQSTPTQRNESSENDKQPNE